MKKSTVLQIAMLLGSMTAGAQTAEMFQPYQTTALRVPSVPLVVNDPYFSIWSPYDKLNEGTTRHWTNDEKPLQGWLRVDGVTYCFMGADRDVLDAIAPMADEGGWKARYSREVQQDGWQKPDFDDASWREGTAAFGSPDLSFIRTEWREENSDLYVRRTIDVKAADLQEDLLLIYSHDDVFELFINGTKVADTGETWREGIRLPLDEKLKKLLKPGRNVIAAHCHNTTGGAYTDFGLYKNMKPKDSSVVQAVQKSVTVLATNTYYTFACGPVELDVVFTAPMLMDDYDLLSAPVNYISYQVRSTDGAAHQAQLLLTASSLLAVNKAGQPTVSSVETHHGTTYLKTGTVEQPILAKTGDGICIDWGYLYLPALNGDVALSDGERIRSTFVSTGRLPQGEQRVVASKPNEQPVLAYRHDFGSTRQAASYAMLAYDEIWDIEYFYKRYKGYWAHEGSVSIFDMVNRMNREYSGIMKRCRALDKQIYDDGMSAGDKNYAEILSGSYRHVIAAHKLFRDDEGNLLFFSKENNSNGCVNTVDLTYPEAPLFLIYNPELQKAMMTSIFEYSYTGRWTKPFAAHDLGQYPKANHQVYGGDMPLEEAGNMITLAAMLCRIDGNTSYVDKYWDIITTWADYLSENGQDPSNQLCTDDFAGHWAHNANLSIKAIMGVAGYALMAQQKGLDEVYDKYMNRAREMAVKWEQDAREGDHYRLAFDRKDTWSQKYNMVWDKLWGLNLFPNGAMDREIKYYLTKQNKYGLPLDIRRDYTKSDWIMWTAAMSSDKKTFMKFVGPLYDYMNETESRVPTSDWYDTKTGLMVGFKARSVIGGYWMRVLVDMLAPEASPVDYVSPLVGTLSKHSLSTGNTYPAIALPWGMNFWTPQTGKMGDGWQYVYTEDKIRGFKQTHQPSPWINDYGQFSIMPVVDRVANPTPDLIFDEEKRASWFSHKTEDARAYYYKVYLADYDVWAEIAPTERAAVMRFTFPESTNGISRIVVDAFDKGSAIKYDVNKRTITGYTTRNSGGVPDNFRNYFVLQFDTQFQFWGIQKDGKQFAGSAAEGDHVLAMVGFPTKKGQQVTLRVASSFISEEQAWRNLQEVDGRSFDQVCADGRQRWNDVLGRVEVNSQDIDHLRTFYSCLYRSVLFPRSFYEFGADGKPVHYSPHTGEVCPGYYFTDTGFWDTFRSLFPLLNLLYPEMSAKMQEGLVNCYKESGFLPEWASPGHRGCMVGNNSASVVADAYLKLTPSYDIETLWQAVVHGANAVHPSVSSTGRLGYDYYNRLGYVPYNVGINENVARTLEYAYDDWCIYQLGKALGKSKKELKPFRDHAMNYKNVFDPETRLMRGRNEDGTFQSPFSPLKWGDAFTEGNAWHYTWSVFHDPEGLIRLMGGNEVFVQMLDSVFNVPPLFDESYYGGVIHEIREMQIMGMGNYAHGNQPIQHMIYLYDWAAQPWKAQYWVREAMDRLYTAQPDGYCGDEDNGQTSAWYVFSAMGFYPVCPGSGQYALGTPYFPEMTLHLQQGRTLTIQARGNSDVNRYIGRMELNGQPYDRNYLDHDVLMQGGTIVYTMQSAPNRQRGISPEAAPYSFSKEPNHSSF